jgi:hypothetical protein
MSGSRSFSPPELLPSLRMSRQILGYLGSDSGFSLASAKNPLLNS